MAGGCCTRSGMSSPSGPLSIREEHSLQKIRRAVQNLRDLGNTEHVSRYQLLATPAGIGTDLVREPGNRPLDVTLADVVGPFDTATRHVAALFKPRELLDVDPDVCGGYPVVTGTRVLFDQVASLVTDGVRPEHIDRCFPGITAAAAEDATSFAAEGSGIATAA